MIGIGIGIGFMAGAASGYDVDAAAFFARVTAAGGTLTLTEKTAVNTLVVQMKADGTWTSMKAIYPMVGASAASEYAWVLDLPVGEYVPPPSPPFPPTE
jgi:hypothetical protein